MIIEVQPIANTGPQSVDWNWLVINRHQDAHENELFGKLIRPVIIGEIGKPNARLQALTKWFDTASKVEYGKDGWSDAFFL